MALISPGVEVSIIDETQYVPTAVGTVAYILIASKQDKTNNSGALAYYTTKGNAGKVIPISSQRELVQFYGTSIFQNDASGNPIHGDERNEYGLFAAYSALGVGNRVLIQRADIDLAQLVGTYVRPTGRPADGTFWLDLDHTNYGVYEWNQATGFTNQTITAITDPTKLIGTVPINSVGAVGDYAVVSYSTSNPIYYKRYDNTWASVGSEDWQQANPTVIGTVVNPANLSIGQYVTINSTNVQITGTTIEDAAVDISAASITGVYATVSDIGQLEIRVSAQSCSTGNIQIPDGKVTISLGVAGPDAARELGLLTSLESTRTWYAPAVQYGSYVDVPAWRQTDQEPRPDGSIWLKTSTKGSGANWSMKQYSETLDSWTLVTCPLYANDQLAISALDPLGGGSQLPVGSLYIKYDTLNVNGTDNAQLTFKPYIKEVASFLRVSGRIPVSPFTFVLYDSFKMTVSVPGTTTPRVATIVINGTTVQDFVIAVQSARLPNITCTVETTGAVSFSHLAGGTIRFDYVVGTPLVEIGLTGSTQGACADHVQLLTSGETYLASPWTSMTYAPSTTTPYSNPMDGTLWYFSNPVEVDIMMHDGNGWKGYKNVISDARGYDLSATDPTGPILAATRPISQSDGTSIVPGDIWIDTSDLENYPVIHRYERNSNGSFSWVLIDNKDDVSSDGILFADARWDSAGTMDPIVDDIPSITVLAQSDYLDHDAPDYRLYARGTLLFNTRRSGFNVKRFEGKYHSTATVVPTVVSSWVSHSGVDSNGVPYFGHKSQRNTVVEALKATIESSTDLREDKVEFNLMVCPGYPELIQDMITLNNDRKQTAFIIGDSPLSLDSSSLSLMDWTRNTNFATDNGVKGLVSHSEYLAVYYPSGYATHPSGEGVVVPASHMMLRTFIRSDNLSYPWFAPAGVRRGIIDNASAIGYIDITNDNLFQSIGLSNSLRDILYENNVNPITIFTASGIVAYGQKTRASYPSSIDRVNVSRLVCYLRIILDKVARPFIFEPNDKISRVQVKQAFEQVLNDLIAKRGITDYLVVCDETNNTSDRISRNELWVDIAIEPTRAIEFVYIPLRLKNPGTIGNVGA